LYKLLGLFSKLRRLNPAISLGSQQQKYITTDIYCYTRSYRDSRCFVAINKGNPTSIHVESTSLEDGEYNCIVTHRSFEVKDGQLSDLFLDHQEVIVLSYIGDRVQGKTIVRVQLNGIKTELGESIVVTGDCPELGNWNIDQAYALEYINANTWFGEIPFNESAGKAITYKYAIRRENQRPVYENLVCRRWILVNQGIVKWQDVWTP
jgi:cyclomaltodextrin glucanotransferase